MILSIDFLGVEGQGPSEHFAYVEADLIVKIEPIIMVVDAGLLFVVDGCEGVECACYLEHFLELILEELFSAAVVVEAEVRQIIKHFLNSALGVNIIVDVVEEAEHVDRAREVE